MNERLSLPALFLAACAILAIAWAAPARAADPDDDSIILVAKRQLQDKLYGSTILLARPIGAERHVGFIINKPTQVTLGKLFPTHEPSKKVSRPGVPRRAGEPGSDLRAGAGQAEPRRTLDPHPRRPLPRDRQRRGRQGDREAVRRRRASSPAWCCGARASCAEEIKRGLWYVLDAKADLVLRKSTDGMWEELVGRSERKANSI